MPEDSPNDPRPFVVKKRRLACENEIWRVYLDHVVDENSIEIDDYLVLEIKSRPPGPGQISGVGVMPIIGDKLGLIRIYRHAIAESFWEVPRGCVDEGEDPGVAALRELEEETGLQCPPERLLPLGHFCPEAGTIAGRAALFAAVDCKPGVKTGHQEIGLGSLGVFSFDEVRRMADNSVIEDACSLALFYRYASIHLLQKK